MLTVPSLIKTVYGNATTCADKLGVTRPAVSNWKASGQFPARLVPSILVHAKEGGLEIDVEDIPTTEQVRRADA